MSNERFYARTGHVEILNEEGKVLYRFDGLNFKFSYELCDAPGTTGRVGKATVGVLGLSGDTVHRWATYCNGTTKEQYDGEGLGPNVYISVYAGYAYSGMNDDTEPLFTMPIVGAWPTSPPDMWLNFSAFTAEAGVYGHYDVSLSTYTAGSYITTRQFAEHVANTIGAKLRWELPKEWDKWLPKQQQWGKEGTVNDILAYMNSCRGHGLGAHVSVYLGREMPDLKTPILYVVPKIRGNDERQGEMKSRKALHMQTGPIISAETGMIGFPKVKFGGEKSGQIEVQTLLRKDVDIYDPFTVRSEYIRMANATFKCNKIKHVGEFRGTPWYTTLTGIPSERLEA